MPLTDLGHANMRISRSLLAPVEEPIDINCDNEPDIDCQISINPVPDFDRDGFTEDDCDPENPLIYPGASYDPALMKPAN